MFTVLCTRASTVWAGPFESLRCCALLWFFHDFLFCSSIRFYRFFSFYFFSFLHFLHFPIFCIEKTSDIGKFKFEKFKVENCSDFKRSNFLKSSNLKLYKVENWSG
jgi:hypothetical protein